jgi:hypothetical protein
MKTTTIVASLLAVAKLVLPISALAEDRALLFGKEKQGEAALMGIMYDLKQTQRGEPSGVDERDYRTVCSEFVNGGFDESVFNRYYRVSKPRYATQIFVPLIGAGAAPKAFGAEETVKQSRWVIHYKGQVVSPSDGNYRFWGYADDLLVVAVNGQIVLNGSRFSIVGTAWKSTENGGIAAGNRALVAGDWIAASSANPLDLDILVGEQPGGEFCAFLLIEKQGETYERQGPYPVLPIFQLAPYQTPVPSEPATAFASGYPIWKGLQ